MSVILNHLTVYTTLMLVSIFISVGMFSLFNYVAVQNLTVQEYVANNCTEFTVTTSIPSTILLCRYRMGGGMGAISSRDAWSFLDLVILLAGWRYLARKYAGHHQSTAYLLDSSSSFVIDDLY